MKLLFETTEISGFASVAISIVLDAAVKSLAILALTGVAVLCLRRSSAAKRHLVWFTVMVSLLLLPLLTVVLPGWHILPDWIARVDASPALKSDELFIHTPKRLEATDGLYGHASEVPPSRKSQADPTATTAERLATSSSVRKATRTGWISLSG